MSATAFTGTRFDADTALRPLGEGRFAGRIDSGWWVQSGPNGGYLAAILLRAMQDALNDTTRAPRSLFVRYFKPPIEGEVELRASTVQAGRSLTTMSAQLVQGERVHAEASATFSGALSTVAFQDARMPAARPLAQCTPIEKRIPLNERYELWHALGGEFRTGDAALSGGWIRFEEPRVVDALMLAALWDAWPPAVFARAIEQRFRGAVPTVEVSVYFRETFPLAGLAADAHLLMQVQTLKAHDGLAEESSEIWAPDGRLLAQGRQLVLLY